MIRRIISQVRRCLEQGVTLVEDPRKQRQLRIANLIALVFTLISLPHAVLFLVGGATGLAAWMLLGCILYSSPFYWNRKGHFWLGRAATLLTASVVATTFAVALGPRANVHMNLFMLACWSFALFDARRELYSLLFMTSVPMAGFVLVSSELGLGIPKIHMEPVASMVMTISTGIVSFSLFILVLTLLYRRNQLVEDQLRVALSEAQSAARAKTEFLGVVSHELRTPMNGIVGAADLLADTKLNDDQVDLLRMVKDSADFLLILLDDILSFASLEARQLKLERNTVSLRELAEDTIANIDPVAATKGLELVLDIAPETPETFQGDAGRVRQIISNLITNAVKFTDQGYVELRLSSSSFEEGGTAELRVEVIDTGIGIPAELQTMIFERFQQADSSYSRKHGGVGLGLSICRNLVELMKGEIGVTSIPGEGSRFWFRIPAEEATHHTPRLEREVRVWVCVEKHLQRSVEHAVVNAGGRLASNAREANFILATQSELLARHELSYDLGGGTISSGRVITLARRTSHPSQLGLPLREGRLHKLLDDFGRLMEGKEHSAPPTSHGHLRVLVVEDNLTNRQILLRMLNKLEANTAVAENGKQALEACLDTDFDLVLMDVQMPEMNGLDATREIRRLKRRQPAIFGVSANASEQDEQLARQVGMDGYLQKPIKFETVRQLLGSLHPQELKSVS